MKFGAFAGAGRGPSRGRKLSAEELQLVLLALLEEGDAHGYELIRALDEKSGGFYVPSPGVIYPALTYLAEIGRADCTEDGKRKLYTLTAEGRAQLDEQRDDAKAILDALATIGERMDTVRAAFSGDGEIDPALQARFEAMGQLKRALKAKRNCSPEVAQQIAAILSKAAEDISAA